MDDAIDDTLTRQSPVRAPLIGILGGMGPFSTGTFLDLVAAACTRLHGAQGPEVGLAPNDKVLSTRRRSSCVKTSS